MCFMLVLSMMSSVAAGDEQEPPRPPCCNSIFLSTLLFLLSCFPQHNILVLIKASKGKHALMEEEDVWVSWRTSQLLLCSFSQ